MLLTNNEAKTAASKDVWQILVNTSNYSVWHAENLAASLCKTSLVPNMEDRCYDRSSNPILDTSDVDG